LDAAAFSQKKDCQKRHPDLGTVLGEYTTQSFCATFLPTAENARHGGVR
jgi:hypothetical protein